MLKTLAPEFLTLPERALEMFPPRPPAFERTREAFPSDTGLTFDPVAAAECAADLTLSGLFDAQRDARLVEYHARNPENPSLLADVIDATLAATRPARFESDRHRGHWPRSCNRPCTREPSRRS